MIKIGVPKEILPEQRVASVPEVVAKMVKGGMDVYVESGAGDSAHIHDNEYREAGAKIQSCIKSLYDQTDIVLKVNQPSFHHTSGIHELDLIKENSILIAPLTPMKNLDLVDKLNEKKITTFSLDYLPRIARAQSMDILSSMNNIAGYKSVILAANHLGKIFPMMTTAAGTILPAKIIVIGAGVAGLQAIATARRLGGVVLAFDTRPTVAEQVKSLGAEFITLETTHDQSEDANGYAKELSAKFYNKEQDIILQHVKDADVIITTALIPNKKAPLLVTEQMVKEMKPGSVIVDLAIEQGGNCEISESGKIVTKYGITIIGILNMPGTLPRHASQLYAKNIFAFLNYVLPQIQTQQFDFADDIIKSCMITHQGETVHPTIKQAIQGRIS